MRSIDLLENSHGEVLNTFFIRDAGQGVAQMGIYRRYYMPRGRFTVASSRNANHIRNPKASTLRNTGGRNELSY